MKGSWRNVVVYPILFGSLSVLYLWATNLDQDVSSAEALRLLALCAGGTAFMFLFLRSLTHDAHRAGLATLVLVAAFFSYGYVLRSMERSLKRDLSTALLEAWILVAVAGALLAVRRGRRWAPRLTPGLNVIAGVFVLMNVVPIATHEMSSRSSATSDARSSPLELPGVDGSAVGAKRDVYYIVVEDYANAQTLREQYGYDDEPIFNWLEGRGFYVARESVANYPKTTHSLTSTLNMTYLDDLARRMGPDESDWGPLYDLFHGFKVERAFEGLGYRTEHLGSWWAPTAQDRFADENFVYGGSPEFSQVFLSTTMWPKVAETIGVIPYVSFERIQYERVHYQIRSIQEIAADPRPTFTFAHLTIPHPPYVFDAQGRYVPPEVAVDGNQDLLYEGQIEYTNGVLKELVQSLTAGPDATDPIIVIQSDEGSDPLALIEDEDHYEYPQAPLEDLQRKFRIVNAYYLPGVEDTGLYQSITPVNSFRLIFDDYFGAELPLLPDRMYVYQDLGHPYRFTDVTDRLRP
jgi:hypothetical protein